MSEQTLSEFLLARIAEDEEQARVASVGRWKVWAMSVYADLTGSSDLDEATLVADAHGRDDGGRHRTWNADHIARWDPARVLAECEAKRRIVAEHEMSPFPTLALLAMPYADHADYRQEWTP